MINVVIDLSHHNTVTSFASIKGAGIVGVIHKATQGTSVVDAQYAGRRKQALAAGLLWGAYHFADGSDPVAQAKHFLDVVNPSPTDLLVLDFEQNPSGTSMTVAGAEQFVSYIHSITGRWPGFYSGSYIKSLLGSKTSPILQNCWFWLAQYGSNAVVPANWPTWTMWQYTDGSAGPQPHTVTGVGNCDRDQFNGGLDGLMRLWGVAQPAAAGIAQPAPTASPLAADPTSTTSDPAATV